MKYNAQIHHRRSIRLQGYDYTQAGAYFITICCHNRILRFGIIEDTFKDISDVQVTLNGFGQIAYDNWMKLAERFPNVTLDVFQIMPNHMHGIIILNDVGATLAVAQQADIRARATLAVTQHADIRAGASPAPTIGDIVGAYKSLVANDCLNVFKKSIESGVTSVYETMGKLWQRNYHEHIIRNEESYQKIAEYIVNNPAKWREDTFFTNK